MLGVVGKAEGCDRRRGWGLGITSCGALAGRGRRRE